MVPARALEHGGARHVSVLLCFVDLAVERVLGVRHVVHLQAVRSGLVVNWYGSRHWKAKIASELYHHVLGDGRSCGGRTQGRGVP